MKRTSTRKAEVERCERLARELDLQALRLARGRPAVDVALGEVLVRLSDGDRLLELGFARKKDFANEKLGLPPRTFFALCDLARGLRERPVLKQAVLAGLVSPLKARTIMKLAVGEKEAELTAAAAEMTVEALEKLAGGSVDSAAYRAAMLRFRMTPDQQDRLDYALSLAKEVVGYDASRARLTEEVAREWLVSGGRAEARKCCHGEEPAPSVARQLEIVGEARVLMEGPADGENALGLLAQAKRLLARRERFDEPLGRVLGRIAREELWWWLGYGTLGEYCRERLGMSESTARQRIRLEKKLDKLPPLRRALAAGKITYTKALEISRHATRADVEERIAAAAGTTWQQTNREADAEEDRQDRKAGIRKVLGRAASIRLVSEAILSARKFFEVSEGEAAARMADHYAKVWEVTLARADWRRRWEKDVLLRHGGLCAVPGCTREAKHLHHIQYRSEGGPDEPWNCLATCKAHHLMCIHRGSLTVRGRGGEHLRWVFRTRDLVSLAVWETRGLDEVRRLPFAASA